MRRPLCQFTWLISESFVGHKSVGLTVEKLKYQCALDESAKLEHFTIFIIFTYSWSHLPALGEKIDYRQVSNYIHGAKLKKGVKFAAFCEIWMTFLDKVGFKNLNEFSSNFEWDPV